MPTTSLRSREGEKKKRKEVHRTKQTSRTRLVACSGPQPGPPHTRSQVCLVGVHAGPGPCNAKVSSRPGSGGAEIFCVPTRPGSCGAEHACERAHL
jgi:hypothetical protein